MRGPKNIGIVADPVVPFWKAVIDGVAQYSLEVGDWSLETTWGVPCLTQHVSESWRGDGLIGDINPRLAGWLRRKGIPFVNTSSTYPKLPLPSVVIDSTAVGRLAAQYLLEQGWREFAVVQCEDCERQMPTRAQAFYDYLAERGHTCTRLTVKPIKFKAQRTGIQTGEIEAYLRSRSEPVGVFAVQDPIARGFIEAVLDVGLRVPEDVAVLGAGNWKFTCEMVLPRLTSIDVAADRLGYCGAQLLDSILNGKPPPSQPIWTAPRGVHVRRSTDTLAVRDEQVRQALEFIQQHQHVPIQVDDVINAASIGRRALEKRFCRYLGRSIHEEIRHRHIKRACQLLISTDWSIHQISEASGYITLGRFNAAFRKEMKTTPSQYRAMFCRRLHSLE